MAFLLQGHPAALHSTPTIGREARGNGGVYWAFVIRPLHARQPVPGGGKEFTPVFSSAASIGLAYSVCGGIRSG